MTDRELLELAAKAANVDLDGWDWGGSSDGFYLVDSSKGKHGFPQYWNPLADDGDALRLAVKLDLSSLMVYSNGKEKRREFWSPNSGYDGGKSATTEDEYTSDPYAATRHAIVRAAAAAARDMP